MLNRFERKFKSIIKTKGWKPVKLYNIGIKGVPDFIIYKKDKLRFVEVKGTDSNKEFILSLLSKEQRNFIERHYDICYVCHINKSGYSFYGYGKGSQLIWEKLNNIN